MMQGFVGVSGLLRFGLFVFCLSISVLVYGAGGSADPIAKADKVKGDVKVTRPSGDQPVTPGFNFLLQDVVTTGAGGRVRIHFADDSMVTLAEQSSLQINQFALNPSVPSRKVLLTALSGIVNAAATKSETGAFDYRIRAANVYSAVRGTNWVLALQPALTAVYVLEGRVEVGTTNGNRIVVDAGFFVTVDGSGKMSKVQPIPPATLQQIQSATDVAGISDAPAAPAPVQAPAPTPTETPPAATPPSTPRKTPQPGEGGGHYGGGG
jgi:hypothetical protein